MCIRLLMALEIRSRLYKEKIFKLGVIPSLLNTRHARLNTNAILLVANLATTGIYIYIYIYMSQTSNS